MKSPIFKFFENWSSNDRYLTKMISFFVILAISQKKRADFTFMKASNSVNFTYDNISKFLTIACDDMIEKATVDDYLEQQGIKASDIKGIKLEGDLDTIDNTCFANYELLINVTFSNKISTIQDEGFMFDRSIQELYLPENLLYIGRNVFNGCSSLYLIKIPDTVKILNEGSFKDCTSLTRISLSKSMVQVNRDLFRGCTKLKDVGIPNHIQLLLYDCFHDCASLPNFTIHKDIIQIKENIFIGCVNLRYIYVEEGNKYFSGKDGALLNKDQTEVEIFPAISGKVVLPSSVRSFFMEAFFSATSELFDVDFEGDGLEKIPSKLCENTTIRSIRIPDSVDYIGYRAFLNCYSLENVVLPKKLMLLDFLAFANCRNAVFNQMPQNTTFIGNDVFNNCLKLEKVQVSPKIIIINSGLFNGCSNLREIKFTEDSELQKIFFNAFTDTAIESIILPKTVSLIDKEVFKDCNNLKHVSFAPDSSLKTINDYSFSNCISLESIKIPAAIEIIGDIFDHKNLKHQIRDFYYCGLNQQDQDLFGDAPPVNLYVQESYPSDECFGVKPISKVLNEYCDIPDKNEKFYFYSGIIVGSAALFAVIVLIIVAIIKRKNENKTLTFQSILDQ